MIRARSCPGPSRRPGPAVSTKSKTPTNRTGMIELFESRQLARTSNMRQAAWSVISH